MNWEARWKLVAELVTELRKSNEPIPDSVMKDLRSAKTMIEILKADRSHSENLLRTEEYLSNLESYLVPAAKKKLGTKYVDEWTNRLFEIQRSDQEEEGEPPAKTPLGIPRGEPWIRVQESRETPLKKIKGLAEEIGLEYKIQEDDYLLVHGEEDKVKAFVKKIAELIHKGTEHPK